MSENALLILRGSSPGAYGGTGKREEELTGGACCFLSACWSSVVSIWIARGGWDTRNLTEQSARGDGKE